MIMKLHTLTTLGALTIAGILISSSASAADYGYFPANNCKAIYGSQNIDFTFGNKYIKNNSSSNRWVVCPLDNFNNSKTRDWLSWRYIEIEHRDPTWSNKNITCIVYNHGSNTNSYTWNSATARMVSTYQRMYFETKSGQAKQQTLQCLLPPNGQLYYYRVSK